MMVLQSLVLVVVPLSANPQLDGKHSQKLSMAFVCQSFCFCAVRSEQLKFPCAPRPLESVWCDHSFLIVVVQCPGERGTVVALLCLGLYAFNLLQAVMYTVTGTSEKIFTKMWEKLIFS